jgi:hypothetical protein
MQGIDDIRNDSILTDKGVQVVRRWMAVSEILMVGSFVVYLIASK